MKQELFSVYDGAAQRYLEPFYAPTVEYAMRQFRHTVNKEGHQFNAFPEDYTLFHVGSFDQETGKLEPKEPRSLGVAITFMDRSGPQLEVDNA